MVSLIKRQSKKAGLDPGTVVFVGERKVEKTTISIIDYDQNNYQEKAVASIEECFPFKETPTVTWINIDGIHDIEVIEKLGAHFDFHPLILEDIANTGHRPKMEESEHYIFLTLKMIYFDEPGEEITSEQVSIIFGENYVISFQERAGDVFDSVRERIKKTMPRSRFLGSDYLAYSLVDATVDHYFSVLENIGDGIESIEEELITNPGTRSLQSINDLKRELALMRKRVWPLREVVGGLERSESKLVHKSTRIYLRDLYEHVIQVIDTVETFRDMTSSLLDIYLSSVSNKMNEVMKVLTIFATIFIPLGFLAGVYGMNFDHSASPFNMPELGWRFGYLFFWSIAILIGGGLLWFFRRKGWL